MKPECHGSGPVLVVCFPSVLLHHGKQGGHLRDCPNGRTFESEDGSYSFLSQDSHASQHRPRETQVYTILHLRGLR